jgi:predicted O-methyltransferase YrrM
MGRIVPDAIERYLSGLNRGSDRVLDAIARGNETRGLPLVDAEVGALLRVLATAINASRILEIGAAIGYSGIWLAGALPPGGMLITMEMDEDRAREARENFARAGLADRVSVVVGDAQLKLAKVRPVRSHLPGRRQTALHAAARSAGRAAAPSRPPRD